MDAMNYGIEELELGVRAYNVLKRCGVNTIGEFMEITANDLNEWSQRITNGFNNLIIGFPAAMEIAETQAFVKTWK